MAVTLTGTAFDDLGALLALAVHIDARIEGVLQDRDHVPVANRHPFEAGHPALIGWPWEVNLVCLHRQEHVARATQWIEHPAGHHHDRTSWNLHPEIPTVSPLLHLPETDLAAKTRMPTVMNFQFPPDMGRMNGQLL